MNNLNRPEQLREHGSNSLQNMARAFPGAIPEHREDDEFYQDAGADYARQQDLVNSRLWWIDDSDGVEIQQLERRLSGFYVMFRVLLVAAIAASMLFLFQHLHRGHTMSEPENKSPPPAAQPQGTPHPLPGAINRFAESIRAVGTHPDTGMFCFDALELTVNGKLETLKIQALIDALCAAGILDRKNWENRLEVLLNDASKYYEEGARRLAFTARTGLNGSGHG